MGKKLKIIFFGSSNFSLSNLIQIFKIKKFEIQCIFTKDNSNNISRNNKINIIEEFSKKNNIKIFKNNNLNNNYIINEIYKLKPELIVLVSYGVLIPEKILNIPKFGCINLHCSMLPKWRGSSPIYWSLLSGDKESGISIIKMDSSLDTGKIIFQKKCLIDYEETYISLQNKLLKISIESLIFILNKFLNKEKIHERNQIYIENIKYAKKINKKDALINWSKSSIEINRSIRAYNLWPGSYFIYKDIIVKVWESKILNFHNKININPGEILFIDRNGIGISTGKGIIQISIIQFPGKNRININDYINSNNNLFIIGDIITN